MVDYKVQAELEYSKLLDSDSVNPELLEHDMFYEKFMEHYEAIGAVIGGPNGRNPIEVILENGKVILKVHDKNPQNDMKAVGFIPALEDANVVAFSIEEVGGKKYLRVENNRSIIHPGIDYGNGIPPFEVSETKDVSLGNHSNVELYDGDVLVGEALFENTTYHNPKSGVSVDLAFTRPNMSTEAIIQGIVPRNISLTLDGDYEYKVFSRPDIENGLVEKSSVFRTDGIMDGKSSTAVVDLKNPNSFYVTVDFVEYDKDMNMTKLNPQFSSPTEARAYYTQLYKESIAKGKKIS